MAKSPNAPKDYVHGSQEISEQDATFAAFVVMTKWGSLLIAAMLLLLVLWFQPGGSFISGAIATGVLLVGGWFMLKSKKAH